MIEDGKLAKALYELNYSIGKWIPLKEKSHYREQLQIVRDAFLSTPSDPLPSDRDVAEKIFDYAWDWAVSVDDISEFITKHREVAVKEWQEKLRSLLSGFEAENIGYMLDFFSVKRFENYGAAYVQLVKARISEAEKKAREEERTRCAEIVCEYYIDDDLDELVSEIMQGDGK
jgi:hypothetical protein